MNDSNKKIVLDFYKQVFGELKTELMDHYISENYIQHSPMLRDGKSGLAEALEYMKKMPRQESRTRPTLRVIADGDLVAVHWTVNFGNINRAVIDLFRLDRNMISEHWDAIQVEPDTTLNGNKMTGGPHEPQNTNMTQRNKQLAIECCIEVFIRSNIKAIDKYIHSNVIQHTPDINNHIEGLIEYLGKSNTSILKIHRVIGEGDLVLIQSEGRTGDKPIVFYFIFRFDEEKVREQWSVWQEIPPAMPHGNGMI